MCVGGGALIRGGALNEERGALNEEKALNRANAAKLDKEKKTNENTKLFY